MNYIPTNTPIRVEWTVKKGIGNVVEDFSRSEVFLFLETDRDRWAAPCRADDKGLVVADWPKLEEGVYHLDLIWYKGDAELRSIQRSRKICAFAVDANMTGGGVITIKVETVASTYGYDGLSAYEIALIRGNILPGTISEREWAHVAGKVELMEEALRELLGTTGRLVEPIKPLALEDGHLVLKYDGESLYVQNGKLHARGTGPTPSPSPGGGGTTSPTYSEGAGIDILDGYIIRIEPELMERWNTKQDALAYIYENFDGYLQIRGEGIPARGAMPLKGVDLRGGFPIMVSPEQIQWDAIAEIAEE